MPLEQFFPNLASAGFSVTSPRSTEYNCIAWAAETVDNWWWPDPMGLDYWPPGVPREESIAAFLQAYEFLGYTQCDNTNLEAGFTKVALYAKGQEPTHAARQLSDGSWTSKLGPLEDICHTLDGLVGREYGSVVAVLRRPLGEK